MLPPVSNISNLQGLLSTTIVVKWVSSVEVVVSAITSLLQYLLWDHPRWRSPLSGNVSLWRSCQHLLPHRCTVMLSATHREKYLTTLKPSGLTLSALIDPFKPCLEFSSVTSFFLCRFSKNFDTNAQLCRFFCDFEYILRPISPCVMCCMCNMFTLYLQVLVVQEIVSPYV